MPQKSLSAEEPHQVVPRCDESPYHAGTPTSRGIRPLLPRLSPASPRIPCASVLFGTPDSLSEPNSPPDAAALPLPGPRPSLAAFDRIFERQERTRASVRANRAEAR